MARHPVIRQFTAALLMSVPFIALALVVFLSLTGRRDRFDTRLVVVEPGDTVSEIAARSGVVLEAVASLNAIQDPSRIHPNQVLLVPTGPEARVPDSLRERIVALTQVPRGVQRRPWRYIVIHHSATASDCARTINDFHTNVRSWPNGLGYHFVIGNGSRTPDGWIEVGPRWAKQQAGAHAKSPQNRMNEIGIGICLVGNFEETEPTEAQMEALVELVRRLRRRERIPRRNVIGHRDVIEGYTVCPGRHLSIERLRERL